jgi:hypothetical protein
MAKDTQDKDTHDAFTTFEQLERETFIGNALATGGHYQAVKPDKFYQVTGNRYAGSKTPDIVRDKWSTDRSLIAYMEERYGPYDLGRRRRRKQHRLQEVLRRKDRLPQALVGEK